MPSLQFLLLIGRLIDRRRPRQRECRLGSTHPATARIKATFNDNDLIVDSINRRADCHMGNDVSLRQDGDCACKIELVVIVGAEACVLVCIMAMTLRARRMDVLSGRFLQRPMVSPAGNRHSLHWIRSYRI